jgi:scyllo-inositol 2-dehydrogenase (NADP+)
MQDNIRIGIVGLGRAGFGMQCNELNEKKDRFEIVAGCDAYRPWLDRMKDNYPNCSVYCHIGDFLDNPDIELVSIATRSVDHFDHAMLALKAGKNVLIDKPMCINVDQAVTLQNAAIKSKGNLYIRHNRRFDPDFLHVKEIVDSGILGYVHTIKLCRLSYSRRSDWQTLKQNGGGQLLNWGPHIIDHALQFIDAPTKPIKGIWADLKQLISGGDCEDHLKILLKGDNDCIVDIEISGAVALPVPEYVIWGTRGSLTLSLRESKIEMKYLDPCVELAEVKVNDGVPGRNDAQIPQDNLKWMHKELNVCPSNVPNIWDELYDALRNNKTFPIKLEQAVEVMRIISKVKMETEF